MKRLLNLTILFCAAAVLPTTLMAGPEPSGKEMKQVAPAPPPECTWTGFYLGLNVGGQFGHAETVDVDNFGFSTNGEPRPWGYDQSGVIVGGTAGYNFQWGHFVTGPEIDLGYMDANGRGTNPESARISHSDYFGRSESDFYATFRGRIGWAMDKWLFYATGGGIALNWETSAIDNCDTDGCTVDTIDAHKQELAWGWTVGGGVERMIGCHWSVKGEYLFYQLGTQDFRGEGFDDGRDEGSFRFQAHDQGHIVRAGLNYKF